MLNIILDNKIVFIVIASVVLVNFICLIFLILKERKADKEEIEEIVNELMDAKPRDIESDEIIKVDEVVKVEEKNSNQADISSMLSAMKKDLESKNEDVVATFEAEQEEKSIISYQELINSLKNKKGSEQPVVVESTVSLKKEQEVPIIEIDETKEIPVIEIEEEVKEIKSSIEKKDNFSSTDIVKKKFKNTEFISPIYGKMESGSDISLESAKHGYVEEKKEDIPVIESIHDRYRSNVNLEESLDLRPLNEEIRKNDEFLNALKDFRKNLE